MSHPFPDPEYVFRAHAKPSCVSYINLNANIHLLVGFCDGLICIYSTETKKFVSKLQVDGKRQIVSVDSLKIDGLLYICVHVRGHRIALCSINNHFNIQEQYSIPTNHVGFCACVHYSFTSHSLLAVPYDHQSRATIQLHRVETENCINLAGTIRIDPEGGAVMNCAFIENNENSESLYILVSTESGCVYMFDSCAPQAQLCSLQLFTKDQPILDTKFSKSFFGFACSSTACVKKFKIDKNVTSVNLVAAGEIQLPCPATKIAIRTDGKLISLACSDSKVRFYSLKCHRLLGVLDLHANSTIIDAKFCDISDELMKMFVVLSSDNCISLWKLY